MALSEVAEMRLLELDLVWLGSGAGPPRVAGIASSEKAGLQRELSILLFALKFQEKHIYSEGVLAFPK